MIKKIFVVLSLFTLFSILSFATDLLAFYSNGKLTENSPGVKVLTLEEKKQVKGGYVVQDFYLSSSEKIGVAFYSIDELKKGFCSIDVEICKGGSILKRNEWLSAVGNDPYMLLSYTVKKNIGYARYGKYVYFTYGVGAFDIRTQKFYRINSSAILNNNMIIKEIANKYKERFESDLGGWRY
ncbi:bacteriocin [Campylobacter avium]|uniref:bacteriocin n=1 Tax=Campylobacter avium TaxID=522485 RepID=UPI002354E134|nr:bacteriocin [Campylobacter avium]